MITVLTVNHNTLDFLKLLVQSVRKFRGQVPIEIMVIDNQSTDGSREWAAAQPDVEAHLLTSNTGHGPGLDCGLRLVNTRFVLVLDSDAHLQRFDWDADLIKLYQSEPRILFHPYAGASPNRGGARLCPLNTGVETDMTPGGDSDLTNQQLV